MVSHDLRVPLVNIQGFSQELRLTCERLRACLARVEVDEPERRELSALLDEDKRERWGSSRPVPPRWTRCCQDCCGYHGWAWAALTIGPLDMNQMASDIVASMQFAIEQADVSVQVETLPGQGDQLQLNQVFANLLDNALKYLAPNRPGVIRVSGREEPDRVVYTIADNGIGIAAEHQDAIFNIFHRLAPKSGSGEGLGLTIVRGRLDRHGGQIRLESP